MKTLTYSQYEALRDLLADGYDQCILAACELQGDDIRTMGMRKVLPSLERKGLVVRLPNGDRQIDGNKARAAIIAYDERTHWTASDRYMGE